MDYKLPDQENKHDYVQTKFTDISARYDLFNDLITQGMHRYWKNFLVRHSGLKQGDTALDMCCGTGDITSRLSKIVGDKGKVIGLDFSSGMLKVAKERKEQKTKKFFIQGDAMKLPLKQSSIDAVSVGYGLRNVIKLENCLEEVLSALKPGGKFLSLDVGKVKNRFVRPFFNFYFFSLVPIIGKTLYKGEDMFDYLPHSAIEYPSQEKLATILNDVGFTDVKYYNFVFGASTIHIATKKK